MDRVELGSRTAKGGFGNEKNICRKFNNWKLDNEAKEWLSIMGYEINALNSVSAVHIPTRIKKNDLEKYGLDEQDYYRFIRFHKADAQIKIIIKIGNILKIENLSLKKANSDADYNQLDKRKVENYQEMWKFNDELLFWLKLFTGELIPKDSIEKIGKIKTKDERRLFFDEMPIAIQKKIINFFKNNRILVISDIIKGRGGLSTDWMLVTKFNKENNATVWILKDINTVMNFYGQGEVKLSPRGSLRIGKITMQRKGGTPDPTKIQFKFRPCELFKIED